MSLISLNQIHILAGTAGITEHVIDHYLLGGEKRSVEITDELIVYVVKLNRQARNLRDKLMRLHKTCADFAECNFSSYIEDWDSCAEPGEETEPFDPFHELRRFFANSWIDDLPEAIEKYKELYEYTADYVHKHTITRLNIAELRKAPPRQSPMMELDGLVVYGNLSNDADYEEAVKISCCLLGYDQFFQSARNTIDLYRPTNDVVSCAKGLLNLIDALTLDPESI